MKIKRTKLMIITLGLAFGGLLVTGTQPVQASANAGYRDYKTFPKVMRGTWRSKGYTDYYSHKKSANWSYKFNKSSYSIIIHFKSKKKAKVIHFPKNEINEVAYIYRLKKYHIQPKVTKKNYDFAGIIDLKPVTHHGKKALAVASLSDGANTYYYKVK
ncbi:hypothetical protein AZI11_06740 [Levilactobacillus brevis]|uniref:hypothetical protein n=1 Tax=Levilactobacillus brevis TaxID=1580 RepID=UPI000A203138|nr:hypothetical protein [Levilactobacillus brevis]ARN92613.1 hypothetical protein AZI11_06740 [Levilactobacillus brevis]ARN95278.1 hypothetical protein AZI12_06790 [Levilactobacillus brevis]